MTRIAILLTLLSLSSAAYAQQDKRITTMDFVQVLNGSHAETLYYYQNNWKVLREKAVERDYLFSFELLETEPTEEQPYSFILISTYTNQSQYDKREDNFGELIEERGPRKLMNDKQPADFRKIVMSNGKVRHR